MLRRDKKRLEIDIVMKRWQVETLLGLYMELAQKWEGEDELDALLKWHVDDLLAGLVDLMAYQFEKTTLKLRYPEGYAFSQTWFGRPVAQVGSQLVIDYLMEQIDKAMQTLRVQKQIPSQQKTIGTWQ